MADNSEKEFREVVKALNDEMNNSDDLNFDVTLAACLGFKNKYRNWLQNNRDMSQHLKADHVLRTWRATQSNQDQIVENLIKAIKANQMDDTCNSFIAKLQKLNCGSERSKDSTSPSIDEKQWDNFVAFVNKLLEEHPIPQADAVMALNFGSSIHTHYQTWQYQPINIAQPVSLKVSYLLSYWKQKTNPSSMKAMVMAFDQELKSESSFNMMREQIKTHFL